MPIGEQHCLRPGFWPVCRGLVNQRVLLQRRAGARRRRVLEVALATACRADRGSGSTNHDCWPGLLWGSPTGALELGLRGSLTLGARAKLRPAGPGFAPPAYPKWTMGAIHDPFQTHGHSGDLVHPDAPAGGCGPGISRMPGPLCGSHFTAELPHVDSPAGRFLHWHSALDAINLPSRAAAVYRAIRGARAYVGDALLKATGQELEMIIAGILPAVLMMLAVLAATTALGAAAGAAIGALAFGAGAIPGAAIGGELGLDAGIALLDFLGVAFLAVYIGKSVIEAGKMAAHAVVLA